MIPSCVFQVQCLLFAATISLFMVIRRMWVILWYNKAANGDLSFPLGVAHSGHALIH